MGRVSYDSKRIIPAPFVGITKEYKFTDDGTKIGATFALNVVGKIVAYKGSPTSSGTFWTVGGYPGDETLTDSQHLASILRKFEALRDLFSVDGRSFEIQSDDGSPPMKCNPRVKRLVLPDQLNYNVSDYTIELEADVMYGGPLIAPSGEDQFANLIDGAKETWQLEFDERPENPYLTNTFRISHAVEAKGKRFFDENGDLVREAWENGKLWVQSRLGLDQSKIQSSGVMNLPSFYAGRNHVRTEVTDELAGEYSVNENWILSSGTALEDFTVTVKNNNQVGTTAVSIDGIVTGLETRNVDTYSLTESKYTAASGKFAYVETQLVTRAQAYSGKTLNIRPLNYTVGRNPNTGVITYAAEYDNRKSNCLPGSMFENITITDNLPTDIYASIGIIGRDEGPILQSIGTISETSRVLNIEVVMEQSGVTDCSLEGLRNLFNNEKPSKLPATSGILYNIIQAASPVGFDGVTQIFRKDNQENWNPVERRYSLTLGWTYQ